MEKVVPGFEVGGAAVEGFHCCDGVGRCWVEDFEPAAVSVVMERDALFVVVSVATDESIGVEVGGGLGNDTVGVVFQVAFCDE